MEIIETGKCNITRCIDGIIEEEFRFPYMVYCEITDPQSNCQVTRLITMFYFKPCLIMAPLFISVMNITSKVRQDNGLWTKRQTVGQNM